MKARLFLSLAALLLAAGLHAQVKNIGAGAVFYGATRTTVQGSGQSNLYINNYRPLIGVTVFYEKAQSGPSHMFEVEYLSGALDDVKVGEKAVEGWDPATFQPLTVISGSYYFGINGRSDQRLQFPVYLGVGASRNGADPVSYLGFHFAGKLRARFYLTDKLAVWGGASLKYGFGTIQITADETYDATHRITNLEAGLTFTL